MFRLNKLSKRIKLNEGYRGVVYKDKFRNPTIGYGHLIKSSDKFINKKKYSHKTLNLLFVIDLNNAISDFKKYYDHNSLPRHIQEVIIEMVFQMGIRTVLKFKRFNYFVKKKLYYLAALEMIKSKWYQQTPSRADKLITILLKANAKGN